MMVTLARYLLIAIGLGLIPIWKLWILGGWIADQRGQRSSR